MKNISIIGNGFDLSHNLKTKYSDYLDYCIEKDIKDNVLYQYYLRLENNRGWYDFEQDLLAFLEFIDLMCANLVLTEYGKFYQIANQSVVSSHQTMVLYDVIHSMKYPFFADSSHTSILVEKDNIKWFNQLIDTVYADYHQMVGLLKEYLVERVESQLMNVKKSHAKYIDIIRSSDYVYTFNYTSTLNIYDIYKAHHVHGSLTNEIILGIPYSNKIHIEKFYSIFKISQSINHQYNVSIIKNYEDDLNIYFFGMAFGESDHYFFQEIKDWINWHYNSRGKLPPITFNFYYNDTNAKLNYMNNLRIFMGEEMVVRFDLEKKINFYTY